MAGISSKAAGTIQNKEKTFQGQRFDEDLGINLVQFKWRNHDSQIGRFIEVDPLANDYVYNSPYAFSENCVTSHYELEGLEKVVATFGDKFESKQNRELQQSGNLDGAAYNKGFATAFLVGAGATAAIAFPQVAGPILAAEIFGVISPTAPTSIAGTLASETKVLSNIEANAAKGKEWEQTVVAGLSKDGHTNIAEQVTIKAGNGVNTRLDAVSRDVNGKIVLTEAKSSQTAPLSSNQKLAHPSIAKSGGVVVGQGKPSFPGGTKIPPTQVDVARPAKIWEYKF